MGYQPLTNHADPALQDTKDSLGALWGLAYKTNNLKKKNQQVSCTKYTHSFPPSQSGEKSGTWNFQAVNGWAYFQKIYFTSFPYTGHNKNIPAF